MYNALRTNGLWRFGTKNFLVIVDYNGGLWRTIVYHSNDEIFRGYCGSPRLGVLRAVEQARKEMYGSERIRINQR